MTRGSTSLHRKTCFSLLWIGDLLESSMTFRVNVTGVIWCSVMSIFLATILVYSVCIGEENKFFLGNWEKKDAAKHDIMDDFL